MSEETEKNPEKAAAGEAAAASVQAAEPAKGEPPAEDKPAKIEGLAYTGAAIRQAWSATLLVVDLAGMTVPAKVPLMRDHNTWNTDNRLGNVSAKKTERGIEIEGEIVAGTEAAREIVRQGKLGADWQLSIGADITAAERVLEGARTVNGRTFNAPFLLATKTILREVSVVAVGADRSTNMHVAAAFTPTPNLQITMEEKDTKKVEAAAPTAPVAPAPAPETKPADIEAAFKAWRMALAKLVLSRRLARLDAEARRLFGDRAAASGLTVRSLKRRWGSCSVRGQITLAAQLIELPLPLIDYVIGHELCHLRHMDHSPAFHAALRSLLPDAREREKRIRIWSLEHPRS